MNNKSNIRNKLNQKRANLTSDQVKLLSQQVCDNIISTDNFKTSHCVAIYSSLENETDLSILLQNNKRYCMPVVLEDNAMVFRQCAISTAMLANQYGILEPQNNLIVMPRDINLCLMPLVGFNRHGDRLGMGGGYYDRYFEHNKSNKIPTILAGIAYDFQEDDTIQPESWDVPLDMIFTNKEVIYCG